MKLIPEWKQGWKFSSIWLQGAATCFFTYLLMVPDAALHVWAMMPAEVKATLDPKYVGLIGTVLGVVAMAARLVQQRSIRRDSNA